jgi:hypothetical protein
MKTKLLVLLAILSFGFGTENSCAQNIDSGLVAFYPFNGDVKDYSSNALDGTPSNLTSAKGVQGNPSYAYDFNGMSSYIDCGTPNRGISSVATLSAWVKIDSADNDFIVSKYDWRTDKGYVFSIFENSVVIAGRNLGGKFVVCGPTNNKFNDGQWHHLAATIDGNTWTTYLDCVMDSSITSSSATPDMTNNHPMIIGRGSDTAATEKNWFDGTIDEIRIYNRVLSASELALLCNKATGGLSDIPDTERAEIYPNPSNGIFHLKNLPKEANRLELHAPDGSLLLESEEDLDCINLSGLEAAIYFLSITDQHGAVLFTKRIAKH